MDPSLKTLFDAMDRTWAPAAIDRVGPWKIRTGSGGGQRVSAATLAKAADIGAPEILAAEEAMASRGQSSLFMVRSGEAALDAALERARYGLGVAVVVLAGETAELAALPADPLSAIPSTPRLGRQTELWSEAGIGAARMAVMDRVTCPKVHLLARDDMQPAGVAFVAADGEVAMMHALDIRPDHRRKGLGRAMTCRAAAWAEAAGARTLALQVEAENAPALALYKGLGMEEVARYHYRLAPG